MDLCRFQDWEFSVSIVGNLFIYLNIVNGFIFKIVETIVLLIRILVNCPVFVGTPRFILLFYRGNHYECLDYKSTFLILSYNFVFYLCIIVFRGIQWCVLF